LGPVTAPITLLTDYGYEDEFAGVLRAVIAGIAPAAAVIDLTHGIARHDVIAGAAVLARALPYTPPGVHLAVVDPGVGTERRGITVRTFEGDRLLVGPDNGLLWPALERLGGPAEVADVSRSPVCLEPVSATFHGRDVFAPVAAWLAEGRSMAEIGEPIDPDRLVRLGRREPRIEPGRAVAATVAYADRFGNAVLDLGEPEAARAGLRVGRRVAVEVGGTSHVATYTRTFADVPGDSLLLYLDSYGSLALAVNRGSAAALLGLAGGDEVLLRAE
jgi:S-adenosyl-L-methionine hydrolase (adenosine-forming)